MCSLPTAPRKRATGAADTAAPAATHAKPLVDKTVKEEQKGYFKHIEREPATDAAPAAAADANAVEVPVSERGAPAGWAAGTPVPYLALAKVFEAIEQISSRLKIVELLRDFLRQVLDFLHVCSCANN